MICGKFYFCNDRGIFHVYSLFMYMHDSIQIYSEQYIISFPDCTAPFAVDVRTDLISDVGPDALGATMPNTAISRGRLQLFFKYFVLMLYFGQS